jgi:hypothetical protein
MPTRLDKPVMRDTGLEQDGSPVYVTLIPTSDGGAIAFRAKGKRGSSKVISLRAMFDSEGIKRTPVTAIAEDSGDLNTSDVVDLGRLESRIMIDGDGLTLESKIRLWEIIRELREENREAKGFPPVTLRGAIRSKDHG